MAFVALVWIIALLIAGAAAYFSVYGLALIFSGALVPVIIMASFLEIGKLCATSIVYHHWKTMSWMLQTYLVSAILLLMVITSGGIYGFLSAAYQQDKLPLEQIQQRVVLLDQELESHQTRLYQMDEIISSIGPNYISRRMAEVEQQRPERDRLQQRVNDIRSERLDIADKTVEIEAHIGPIIYMAQAMGKSTDQAAHYLIMLFIIVFDPLAIALTICANMLWRKQTQLKLDNQPVADTPPIYDVVDEIEQSVVHEIQSNDISNHGRMPVIEIQYAEDNTHIPSHTPEIPQSATQSKPSIRRQLISQIRNNTFD